MPSLRVLNLMGNPVKSTTRNYRNILTVQCKNLQHLDDRPIFPRDRACAEAWLVGGHEAAERVRLEWIENERLKLQRSCEALMRMKDLRKLKSLEEANEIKAPEIENKENTKFDQSASCGNNESSDDEETGVMETKKSKIKLSSQDNTTKENGNKELSDEKHQNKILLNYSGSCENNIETEEIEESNVQLVHNNISKNEQNTIIQMNEEENLHSHLSISQRPTHKNPTEMEYYEERILNNELCLQNSSIKEDPKYSFISTTKPNQLSSTTNSEKSFIEDFKIEGNQSLKESVKCHLPLHSSINSKTDTKPLIEEILSSDKEIDHTEGIFHFKETKVDGRRNNIEEYIELAVQASSTSNEYTNELSGIEDQEENVLQPESKDALDTEISPKKLTDEIFNKEYSSLSQDQDICHKVEETVNSRDRKENIEQILYSEVPLRSGQVGEENTSKQLKKRKTLEHATFNSKPLKLKKVEAKEDISIKKTENGFDLFGHCNDQSSVNDISTAAKDDFRHTEMKSPNNGVKRDVEFPTTHNFKLKQTNKETSSSLSCKLLEGQNISSYNCAPLNKLEKKSSCVTLADWQKLVYGESYEDGAEFIIKEEQTKLKSDERKAATDNGSDISDTDSYSDTIKRGLTNVQMVKTNMMKIGTSTEIFSSLPNIVAVSENCNAQENKTISCSMPNIFQPFQQLDENFPKPKKGQLKTNYSLLSELPGVKSKTSLEDQVAISKLNSEIDDIEEPFLIEVMKDVNINKIANETCLSSAEKDPNDDELNPVNLESTEVSRQLVDTTHTKQTIVTNDSHLEELEDDLASLPINKFKNEENTTTDPQVIRYINRSLELQMASSQSKAITRDTCHNK